MTRLQICLYNRLHAELIAPSFEYADQAWHDWMRYRWKAGKPLGGSIINHVKTPAAWTVPVGACINCGEAGACEHDPIEAVA
jgi:hypothetical protein